jgi:hypothetical protein
MVISNMMKKRVIVAFLICIGSLVLFSRSNSGMDDLHGTQGGSVKGYEIEDIAAEVLSEGTVIHVSGKIRNLRKEPIQGHVIIYMVDGADGVIHTVQSEVNRRNPIVFGGVGDFEVYENIEGDELESIANIYIDLVKR